MKRSPPPYERQRIGTRSHRTRLEMIALEDRTVPTTVTISALTNLREGDASTPAFQVTRDGSTSSSLTVFLAVSGTATPGSDFTFLSSQVTIPSGSSSANVNLHPIDDSTSEPTETVILTVQSGTGYTPGSPASATVNIYDNDADVVTVSKQSDTTEGDTAGQFLFTRTGDLSTTPTVNFTPGGTATGGTDFTSIGTSVMFAANSATATVAVTALPDNVVEGDETVSVTLGSGTGYTIASPPPSATVTIHDDPPVISVDGSDTVEGSTTGGFTLIRTGGDLSSSLTVTYTVGGTATSGTDYTALSGTATFAAGSNVVDVPVEALTITGGTTVTLTIDDGGTDYTIDMDAGDSTINIDDQPVEVSVQELADATEGGASGTFRFTRSGDLSSSLVATYTVAGTAAAGTNYTALSGTVTFAASSDHTDVTLTPLDDLTVDPTLTVTVTLDTSDDYMLGNNSDTAFIWDGDGAPVYWISTGSTDWTTAANWSSGTVPTASDDVYFNGSGGTYYSNVSCTNAGYGLSTLAGLHMVGSYSGTVTLASALTIDTFVESSGTLSQNYLSAAKDLSVDKAFLWTGGTLNATDNGANVTIDGTVGAVGRIDPPDTGSIATASTLNVISGALLGILPGELDFTGGSGIYIAAEVKAFTGDNIKEMNLKTTKTDTKVEIASGGELLVSKMNQVAKSVGTSELPILNSGGSFQIIGNLDLTVKGHVDGTTGPSISQTSGSFLIYSGTTLTTEFGMLVTSGSLKTRFDGVGLKATIKGSLTVGTVGGTDPTPTVEFDHIAGAIQAGTLAVEGDVTWNRGTFKPVLTVPTSPVNGGLADSWSATGTFTIGAAASLVPICPNKNTATAGNFWSILTGLSGIVGDAPTLPDGWGDFSTIFVDGKGEAKTLQIKR